MSLVLGDCKIVQTSLHAREGDPAYTARAVFEVLELSSEIVPVILAGEESRFDGDAKVWRSLDNGETWTANEDPMGEEVGYIYCFAEMEDRSLIAGTGLTPACIYKSLDHGATWGKVAELGDEWSVNSLLRLDNGDVIAGTYAQAEFWRSQDDGKSWHYQGAATGESWIVSMIQAGNGDVIAGTTPGAELWRSSDGGQSWFQTDDTPNTYINCFVRLSNDYLICGVGQGAARFYQSTDNGASWALLSTIAGQFTVESLCVASNGDLLAGVDNFISGSIYRSQNNGVNWASVKALGNEKAYEIVKAPTSNNLVAVTYRTGSASMWVSRDDGATWAKVKNTSDANVFGFLSALSAGGPAL